MLPRSTFLTLLAALAVFAALAPVAGATARRTPTTTVKATLTFSHVRGSAQWRNLRVTIFRDGRAVLKADPSFGDCRSPYCSPGGFTNRGSVYLRDLDGDGENEVVVDLFTGGAHCCFVSRFYRWTGTTYDSARRNFGDPGYRITDIGHDGVQELISADPRFADAFSAFAFSLLPVRIFHLQAGRWHVVTRRFPGRVRQDAATNWRLFVKAGKDGEPRGAIAAWAADQYLLGRRGAAQATLAALARDHRLPGGYPNSQTAFVGKLERFLARSGY